MSPAAPSPERWQRLSRLFDQALDLDPEARAALLDAGCAGDPAMRAELERMLAADAAAGVLDAGAAGLADFDPHIPDAADTAAEDAAALGERLGTWRLEAVLGRGGMGTVYAARREDGDVVQRAAIKRLQRRWDGSVQAQRFLQERRILAALSHPNIAHLLDSGLDDEGRPWFALEYVGGAPLTVWADAQRLDLCERIALIREVCAAVQHAHEHFVVHRDLKPANILVDADGHPKVLDFGVAKRIDDAQGATRAGVAVGFTPEYAAPEQVAGGAISAATDVHALGVILYQLLSGRLPYAFDQHSLRDTAETIVTRQAARLDQAITTGTSEEIAERLANRRTDVHAFRRFARGDLARIVQTALAKEPPRRYASVQAFSADLGRFLEGRPVSVSGDTFAYRAGKFVRRNRVAVAAAALIALSLCVGAAGVLWQAGQARREAEAAIVMKDYLIDMFRQADVEEGTPLTARGLLARGVGRLDALPRGSPPRLELASLLIDLHTQHGLAESAVAVAERELGEPPDVDAITDPARLRLLIAWANAHYMMGYGERARPLLAQAIERFPGRTSPTLADALTKLAMIDIQLQRFARAERSQRVALSILRRTLPDSDERVLSARTELAAALTARRQGRLGRAQTERALADAPKADSRIRAHVLTMAGLRRALFGEFASAEAAFAQSQRIWTRLGFPNSSEFYLMSRAVNALDLGRIDQAQRLVEQALSLRRKRGREYSPGGWYGLAELLWLRGEVALLSLEPGAAAGFFGEAADLALHSDKTFPAQAAYAASLQAVALVEAGRTDGAQQALDRALPLLAQPALQRTYAKAMTHAAQGVLLSRRNRHAAAIRALDLALAELGAAKARTAILEHQLKEHRDTVRYLTWKARAQLAAGSAGAARETLAQAQRVGLPTLGATHPFMRQVEQIAATTAGRARDPDGISR